MTAPPEYLFRAAWHNPLNPEWYEVVSEYAESEESAVSMLRERCEVYRAWDPQTSVIEITRYQKSITESDAS